MEITIKEVRITDVEKKLSRLITFDKGINLLTSSSNSLGKSVILKSIYHSMGADSFFDAFFSSINNLLIETTFEYNNVNYSIIRFNNDFCILKNGKYYGYYPHGDRNQLAIFYEKELNASVYLRNREGVAELAPPAYLFIPYYLDQDRSWKDNQYPFSAQSMNNYFASSTNELFLYHLGLFDKKYGELKAKIDALSKKISTLSKQRNKYDESLYEIKDNYNLSSITLDETEVDAFIRNESKAIDELILNKNDKIAQLNSYNQKRTECNIRIKENEKILDYIENNKKQLSASVKCPICHNSFEIELESGIINTYNSVLLSNEIESIKDEITEIDANIFKIRNQISDLTKQIDDRNAKLQEKNQNYASYLAWSVLSKTKEDLLIKIKELDEKIKTEESTKAGLEKEKRAIKTSTLDAKNVFSSLYCEYLNTLGVDGVTSDMIVPFYKLKLSGSQFARSTLSLYFSFLMTKVRFNSDGYNFPLVIDSPREGEQDNLNSEIILRFILSQKIEKHQIIIATVDAKTFLNEDELSGINVIELSNEKMHLLVSDEYSEKHTSEIIALLKKI